jgi:hypothetical protein
METRAWALYRLDRDPPMIPLHRYWIRFQKADHPTWWNLGCGVTAYTRDDAIGLAQRLVSVESTMPEIADIVEDVNVQDLDQNHVVPNMGDVARRGIWYPRGLEDRVDARHRQPFR